MSAAGSALFQLYWFARNGLHQIDFDGIDYLGIARHIRQREFHEAINGFRSPLVSWLIAAVSPFNHDLLVVGKSISISSFLLLVILVYLFTKSLWRSELVAALAALWFTVCRGLPAVAVQFVTPDFLFAGLTVVYFWILLTCLRDDRLLFWFLLGTIHGVAFLCKGFALPWMGLTTLLALLLRRDRRFNPICARFAAAMLVPAIAAAGWGAVLRSKYGEFTAGTQFKVNLLQWTLREYRERHDSTYAVLINQEPITDQFMVTDIMPPGSWPWRYKLDWPHALPKVAASEARYLPQAVKEILILITPGGALGLFFVGGAILRRRGDSPAELRIVLLIAASTLTLLIAYCMLVFDGRYVYPLIPLLLVISARGLVSDCGQRTPLGLTVSSRIAVTALMAGGVLFSVLYWASPFRTLRQDYQASCYAAAEKLREHPGTTVVTVGSGPYPEHGVGWEAGHKTAFFADRRLIARLDDLPSPELLQATLSDIAQARADAPVVWGNVNDPGYARLIAALQESHHTASLDDIDDPKLGEVGKIFFFQ